MWNLVKKFLRYAWKNEDGHYKGWSPVNKHNLQHAANVIKDIGDIGKKGAEDLNVGDRSGDGINPDSNTEVKAKKKDLTPKVKNIKIGDVQTQLMDPNYMGGDPYTEWQKRQGIAEETIRTGVKDAAAGIGQEFRDLKFRVKGMRDPETGELLQTESFAKQEAEIRERETSDLQAAEGRAGGIVGSQLASTNIFGSSGGGARSRAEGRQAKLTQAGQQETRAAADQLIGQKASEDLKLAQIREEEAEDKLLVYAEKEQNAFRVQSEAEKAAADAYRPDVDWQRNVAAQNTTTMNQSQMVNMGFQTQLSAINAQSASTMVSGLMGLIEAGAKKG